LDGLVLVLRDALSDEVDLVLQDDDVPQPHDLNSSKVLAGLWAAAAAAAAAAAGNAGLSTAVLLTA
jgi:hypothetical protein